MNASSGSKRLAAIDALVTAVRDAGRSNNDQIEATNLEQALIQFLPQAWNYKYDETNEDASILASLCKKPGASVIRDTLLPIAKKSTNITFLQDLIYNVTAKVTFGEVSPEDAKSFCDQMLANLASSMRRCCPFLDSNWNAESLREGDSSEKLSWTRASRYERTGILTGPKFAALVETCEAVKSGSLLNKMIGILTNISHKSDKDAFSNFLLPTLASLPPQQVNSSLKLYIDLFRTAIFSYTNQFVPTHAQRIQDWISPRRGCSPGCADCRDLDRFLTAVDEPAIRFAVATPRRKHLEKQLLQSGVNVSTDTKSGSPYKLVVQKTRNVWRDDVESLQKTRQSAANDIFRIGKDNLRSMLGEEQYKRLHAALGIPYTRVLGPNEPGPARAPLADIPSITVNTQGSKRAHGQAFDEDSMMSKGIKQSVEVIDIEAED